MIELKGLNEDTINKISEIKNEPDWMREFRLKSLKAFLSFDNPNFGPTLDIDYDNITYYKGTPNKSTSDWNNIDSDTRNTFDELGLIEAEHKYLDGVGTQLESESIYHNMIKELTDKNVIFCDTDTALREYPELFKKYFGTLVNYQEHKFAALNSACWSGGTFIYVPKNVVLDRPLQSYFRMNTRNMGQFERTLIIVDENSSLHYVEGCSATSYSDASLHAANVEIFVEKNATCRYTTIQNWSDNVLNLVTKRAICEEGAVMEWIDGNMGSRVTMKYPTVILKGDNSVGKCVSISVAGEGQYQDTGAKMIHLGKNTKSNITAKSIAANGGISNYRGTSKITTNASNSKSDVKCDTIILDDMSKSDTIPKNINNNNTSNLEHEATIYKINEEKLFYMQARGINVEKAREMLIMGFTSAFKDELPMEYAVELNSIIKRYIY